MKRPVKFAIAAFTLGLALPAVQAQDTSTPPPPPPPPAGEHEGHHKGPRVESLKFFSEKLNLTEDQQAKIKPILDDQKKSLDALRDDTATAKDDKRAKFMEIRKAHRDQIRAVLTPEQQKKLDELKEEFGRRPGGPGGPGGPSGPSQPPTPQQ